MIKATHLGFHQIFAYTLPDYFPVKDFLVSVANCQQGVVDAVGRMIRAELRSSSDQNSGEAKMDTDELGIVHRDPRIVPTKAIGRLYSVDIQLPF